MNQLKQIDFLFPISDVTSKGVRIELKTSEGGFENFVTRTLIIEEYIDGPTLRDITRYWEQ